jgi:hypothetical protein
MLFGLFGRSFAAWGLLAAWCLLGLLSQLSVFAARGCLVFVVVVAACGCSGFNVFLGVGFFGVGFVLWMM